jgi:hypothetical protein
MRIGRPSSQFDGKGSVVDSGVPLGLASYKKTRKSVWQGSNAIARLERIITRSVTCTTRVPLYFR